MVKGIPAAMPPELMKILMEMGHGDSLLICDGNYPRGGSPERCVRMDGQGCEEVLDLVLRFLSLDTFVAHPVQLMAVVGDDSAEPGIWGRFREVGLRYESEGLREGKVERHAFYELGRKCYACVATGETAIYANLILTKGVV